MSRSAPEMPTEPGFEERIRTSFGRQPAMTVMPAGTGILTIEYKLNCLAPGVVD